MDGSTHAPHNEADRYEARLYAVSLIKVRLHLSEGMEKGSAALKSRAERFGAALDNASPASQSTLERNLISHDASMDVDGDRSTHTALIILSLLLVSKGDVNPTT